MLDALLCEPRHGRMPCWLITGDAGMGKTAHLHRFARRYSDHRRVQAHRRSKRERSHLAMPLPYAPLPNSDELLSSWIERIGLFYGIGYLRARVMLDPTRLANVWERMRIWIPPRTSVDC
jgi:hypothetical protein